MAHRGAKKLGRDVIELQDHSHSGINIWDAKYLAIHAAIAKILYSSGAAEFLDLFLDEIVPESAGRLG